ncbi:hypothetical protein A9K55_006523 [Cordyceps militaris]|uniref:Uncharacterized protein n=1 Tax=Cordyceps militaris TaxID=73501 RepID=A0A2H4SDT6_CORMI|nr:hypothetical protein A9K55_006523 [Cordyceps militaris]
MQVQKNLDDLPDFCCSSSETTMSSQYKNDDTANQAAPDPPPSNTNPVTGERLPKGYIAVFEPNNFIYTDNNGIRHNIHLPGGTYKKAMKYYEEKNWNELAKFPAWGKVLQCYAKEKGLLTLRA